jgi:hypothetical protein
MAMEGRVEQRAMRMCNKHKSTEEKAGVMMKKSAGMTCHGKSITNAS